MKGYRFYLEHKTPKDRRDGNHSGNVIAIDTNLLKEFPHFNPEGVVAVFDRPNSPCCWSSASWDYLHTNCKRISEKEARRIHPNLFVFLED